MNDFPRSGSTEDAGDEHVRRLLDEAVSGVEPRSGIDDIHRRTLSVGSTRRPWLLGAGAAVLATAATITAVALVGGTAGTTGAKDPGFANQSPTAAGTGKADDGGSIPSTDVTVPVYYVGDTSRGPRLFREFHIVSDEFDTSLKLALNEAVGQTPSDGDYRIDWPSGTNIDYVEDEAGGDALTIYVRNDETDIHDRPAGMSSEEASIAIEQLIYTAQATTSDTDQAAGQNGGPVQLMLNGVRTDRVLGVPTSEPVSAGDPSQVLAQVWIIEPAQNARVASGVEVFGLANAFEANVQWELMRSGDVVKSGFTMAKECCTMSPYSFTLKAPPGEYTLVVHDSDPSGGEGFAPWQDTKEVTIIE